MLAEPVKFVVRKLKKAVSFAMNLHKVTARRCGLISSLEAEAYGAWLRGILVIERDGEGQWERGLELLNKARSVYDNLSKLGDKQQASVCIEYRDKLEPSIRYCQYKLGGNIENIETLEALAEGDSSLQTKLSKVLAQVRNEAAEGVRDLKWHGITLPVESQSVRICLHSAREIEMKLGSHLRLPLAPPSAREVSWS